MSDVVAPLRSHDEVGRLSRACGRLRRLRGILLLPMLGLAAAAALLVASAPANAATSVLPLSAVPGFGCTATSSGGVIQLNKILAAQSGDVTRYEPYELVETAAEVMKYVNGAWTPLGAMYTPEGLTTSAYPNTLIGEVNAEKFHAYVTGHGYYAVLAFWEGSLDSTYHAIYADEDYNVDGSPSTYYGLNICKF